MTDHLDEILLEYVQALTLASRALFTQDTAPPPQVTQPALLTLPGDYLCVKVHKRNSLEPRWTDPDKVLLATPFSVSPLGKYGAEWHHLTHTRIAENHTSRTYDQVHGVLLDLEHDAPTVQRRYNRSHHEGQSLYVATLLSVLAGLLTLYVLLRLYPKPPAPTPVPSTLAPTNHTTWEWKTSSGDGLSGSDIDEDTTTLTPQGTVYNPPPRRRRSITPLR